MKQLLEPRPVRQPMRRLLLTCCAVLSFSALAAPVVEDTMAQRVLACTGCHGAEGRAGPDGYYPRIAGKPAGYLHNQLLNFRDGRRQYPLMSELLQTLGDDYLRDMADHFAALDLPYPAVRATGPSAALARGEKLVREGDAGRDLPACASCHGDALMGVAPAIPGLIGLPRDYLAAQLSAWKSGIRQAHAPDCMAQIVKQLSAHDIGAVSQWLAAQTVPAGAKPAAMSTRELPLRCGGVPASRTAGGAAR
ncbi:c-type cytochrome [Methyloversatilis sp.]|uniref:c-type cytochrome n=1 Tax=Methyloversatilis sp. TaxID=2569862 RepID=UPI0027B97AB1|nr:c-type cytochrome [Methyloversatilis sp.]